MLDAVFSWLFVVLLVEIALLYFLLYRRYWRRWQRRMPFAMLGLFSAFMALMAGAVTLGEGPRAWSTDDGALVVGGAAGLLLVIVLVAASKSQPGYQSNALGEAARARDRKDPRRKPGCLADTLGCLVIGVVLLIGLLVVVAIGSGSASA